MNPTCLTILELAVSECLYTHHLPYCCPTGRTGTMVCTWLIDSDQFENAEVSFWIVQSRVNEWGEYFKYRATSYCVFVHQESLEYFGERRTDKSRSSKFQGVETPSQVRKARNVYLVHLFKLNLVQRVLLKSGLFVSCLNNISLCWI